jgi:hypothetical protein
MNTEPLFRIEIFCLCRGGERMKRWFLCVAAFLLLLSGCGFRSDGERAVVKLLDALGDGKLGKAEDYTADGALSFDGCSRSAKAFYKAVFATLDYTVVGEEAGVEGTAVSLTVTAVNMDVRMAAESSRLLGGALSGENLDGESFYKDLTARILDGEAEYITALATAYVRETDEGWRVDLAASPVFADAITGGLGELIL